MGVTALNIVNGTMNLAIFGPFLYGKLFQSGTTSQGESLLIAQTPIYNTVAGLIYQCFETELKVRVNVFLSMVHT